MRTSSLSRSILVGLTCLSSAARIQAATIQTLGSGSALSVAERIATFGTLNSTNTRELGNYMEGGLYITTGNRSWGADPPLAAKLDPFHGATAPDRGFFCVAWDNPEWTSIRTTNMAVMHAAEFVYGNGWTTGDIYGQYPWGNSAPSSSGKPGVTAPLSPPAASATLGCFQSELCRAFLIREDQWFDVLLASVPVRFGSGVVYV
jgi:hypothetical protein